MTSFVLYSTVSNKAETFSIHSQSVFSHTTYRKSCHKVCWIWWVVRIRCVTQAHGSESKVFCCIMEVHKDIEQLIK